MSINPTSIPDDASLERVKEQLRSLSTINPPASLRRKLMADVPAGASRGAKGAGTRRWFKAVGCAAVAAAIVVAASAIVRLGTPSGKPHRPVTDINDGSGRVVAADYNAVRPLDSNVCDNNGLH